MEEQKLALGGKSWVGQDGDTFNDKSEYGASTIMTNSNGIQRCGGDELL